MTFLKFSLKFREQVPYREVAMNALRGIEKNERRTVLALLLHHH
jgi:hypothetical protein